MPATALARPVPISAVGRATFVVMASPITDTATGVPTRAEVNAGDDITKAVTGFDGGDSSSNSSGVLDFSSFDPQKVPEGNTQNDITLTTTLDAAGADVRTILDKGSDYVLMVTDAGDADDHFADVYFVTVASKSKPLSTTGGRTVVFGLTVTRKFEDITIPDAA